MEADVHSGGFFGAGVLRQLMPLPLTVTCFSKIPIGFTFLVPAHPGSPGQRAVKRMCVCCGEGGGRVGADVMSGAFTGTSCSCSSVVTDAEDWHVVHQLFHRVVLQRV